MQLGSSLRLLPASSLALVLGLAATVGPSRAAAQLRGILPSPTQPFYLGADSREPLPQIQINNFTVGLSFYVQPQFEWVDPQGGSAEGSFRVRRARASMRGTAYTRFNYLIQIDMAGSSTRLVDGWIGTELHPLLVVAAGQAKAPFGRQQLTSDTGLQFVDRGILDPRFNPARQPGMWVSGTLADGLTYSAGIFNGDGINQLNLDGDYLKAARVVWNPLGAFALEESSLDFPESPRVSVGAGVMSGRYGTTDYTAQRLGLEGAFKLQGFNAVGEFVVEQLDSDLDPTRDTAGWYVQAGYLLRAGYELAGRYGTIDPDTQDAITPDLTEKGFSLSRYFNGHDMKIQADYLRVESETDGTSDDRVRVQWQLRI
ncbi:MAG: porin [Longimicrobiales bacterium]